MNYKIEDVDLIDINKMIYDYTYALIYMISEVKLCETADIHDINWNECLEARFFTECGEIHVFKEADNLKAIKIIDNNEDFIEKKYKLNKKYHQLGKSINVKEFINYDDDGEAMIELTRICGIE